VIYLEFGSSSGLASHVGPRIERSNTMLIMLRKQVDGKVNVHVPRENKTVDIPGQFESEIIAFKWLLCQQGVRLYTGDLNWHEETADNISADYEVNVNPREE
jgi:hypothetical protein